MRWLNDITGSVDMDLSQLWETVEDRGAWSAAVHGVTESWRLNDKESLEPKQVGQSSQWHYHAVSPIPGWAPHLYKTPVEEEVNFFSYEGCT